MATRAQQHRVVQQRRANPPKAKKPKPPRRDTPVDTAAKGASASDRKAGMLDTADRNRSARAKRKGGAKLESSRSGKPSRRSTRRSEARAKPASSLRRRAARKSTSSEARAEKARARGR